MNHRGTLRTGRSTPPVLGLVEWFRPNEHDRVEEVLKDMRSLGITELRTGVSWADWHTPGGREWYGWLLPRLSGEVNVLPCFHYTPPSLGVEPKTSSPPREPKAYADFMDVVITELGDCFDWVEIWNEPNNLNDWDWRIDHEWHMFSEMAGAAAYWAKQRGKNTVLAGMCPTDPNWLRLMCKRGLIEYLDAVGVHSFPGTWQFDWDGWDSTIGSVREVLDRYRSDAEIWITEAGFSTWNHDEHGQVRALADVMDAPAERVYWYAAHDLDPNLPTQDGLHTDVRHYHMGIKRQDGTPKLVHRLWKENGLEGVRKAAALETFNTPAPRETRSTLITGGAGFVGTNLAHRLLSEGRRVVVFDNLSRPGVENNLRWLSETHGDRVQVKIGDVRDRYAVREALEHADQVFHFAAQVAVTTSLVNPVHDFQVNAVGTLNLLEEIRSLDNPPPLVFTSTNKIYGNLSDIPLTMDNCRYEPAGREVGAMGISERRHMEFHSPYGCSKGAADQYVLDYARTFGLPAVVFRMSCIYGPHQFGTEDQGWIAHFLIRALENKPITIFGNGRQVRDALFVDDLLNAFVLAQRHINDLSGEAFNIGGGPENTLSLLELIDLIGELRSETPDVHFDEWRSGDQKYYVSDIGKFRSATGWSPAVGVSDGVAELYRWLNGSGGRGQNGRGEGAVGRTGDESRAYQPAMDV
ncbi:MAG: NAD-dependent epimerase/dehydratase family protein [Dehalococcoidia bacterium]